ncbi:hypothetical protein FNV43_RR01533 [Rhamnella rubrinervis]|uniref:Uncharacterized protein n=1 Tax=Rhamnella rubrinervis TaxID=2594499 RepID=A0A8K0HR46_9ROSA|nr:hypothetical protein FNV43_RR01533 [Rhamnella rubrinervis]
MIVRKTSTGIWSSVIAIPGTFFILLLADVFPELLASEGPVLASRWPKIWRFGQLGENFGYECNPKHYNLVWHLTAMKVEYESKSEESKLITDNDADSAVQSNTANHPQGRSDDNNHESNDQSTSDVEHESDLKA